MSFWPGNIIHVMQSWGNIFVFYTIRCTIPHTTCNCFKILVLFCSKPHCPRGPDICPGQRASGADPDLSDPEQSSLQNAGGRADQWDERAEQRQHGRGTNQVRHGTGWGTNQARHGGGGGTNQVRHKMGTNQVRLGGKQKSGQLWAFWRALWIFVPYYCRNTSGVASF